MFHEVEYIKSIITIFVCKTTTTKNAVGKYKLTKIRISLLPKLNATFDIEIYFQKSVSSGNAMGRKSCHSVCGIVKTISVIKSGTRFSSILDIVQQRTTATEMENNYVVLQFQNETGTKVLSQWQEMHVMSPWCHVIKSSLWG